MMKFKKVKIEDVFNLKRGFDITKKEQQHGDVPVVSSSGVNSYHNKFKVEGPGVVTGRKGTLGKVFYFDTDFWPHDTTLWVEDFKGNNPRYIYYLLQHLKLENYDVGGANPTLNRNHVHKLDITYIDDIVLQSKIVKKLEVYENLIENNLKKIKLLEESAELIYKEWFVNLKFPGYEKCNIVDGIPEGWNLKLVKEFGEVITGKTPSTKRSEYYDGDVPFVKTPDMSDMYIIKTSQSLTEEGAKSQEKKYVPKNTILVSCIGTVGVVSLTSQISQFNQQINGLITNEENYVYYMYFKFKSLKEYLEALGSSGATMLNVNKGKFENIEVLEPSKELLDKFMDICKPIFNSILNIQYQNEKLKEARDILIPRLISGEIEV